MVDLASLPAEVRTLIEAQAATIASQGAELVAHRAMVETLRLQLARLRRMHFGRSSEKLDAEIAQLMLALEDLEAEIERKDAPSDPGPSADSDAPDQKPARRRLPGHLPRMTVAHEAACVCPQCGGALRPLGEDVTDPCGRIGQSGADKKVLASPLRGCVGGLRPEPQRRVSALPGAHR